MDNLRKAAEMALEALEDSMYPQKKQFDANVGLKQALAQGEHNHLSDAMSVLADVNADLITEAKLAQPEQEPVICDCGDHITPNSGAICGICASIKPSKQEYTAPPSKPWVGLDDNDFEYQTPQYVLTMKYAEAILKDKNK